MKHYYNEPQENDGWGYTLYLKKAEPELVVTDVTLTCGRVGVINNHDAPVRLAVDGVVLTNGVFGTAWGMKLFETRGMIQNSIFTGLGHKMRGVKAVDGHPVYFSPTGTMVFRRNGFFDNGGNCQFVNRDYGFPHPDTGLPVMDANPTEQTTVAFHDCVWHNNAWNHAGNGGGGAAQVALYNATKQGTKLIFTDSVFTNTRPYPGKTAAREGPAPRAAIVVWHESWAGKPGEGTTKVGNLEPDASKFFESLTISRCRFRSTQADRALIQVSGTLSVSITDWKYDAIGEAFSDTDGWKAVIQIDKDVTDPVRATNINIEAVPGAPGNIEHTLPSGEVVVTPVSEGYHYSKE